MNSPIAPAAVQTSELPLASIEPSGTHVQMMRRERFSPKLLQELADSIGNLGILQPLVVRPRGEDKFELVAGERRWLAARIAGLERVPVSIRELTDEQVIEVQLVENLQREGLHELEEAEGYEALMKLKGITADDVAVKVGKSRSYVYARLKLLALGPDGRKAFYTGDIDSSRALYVARVTNPKLQAKALKLATEKGWKGETALSVRQLREKLTGDGFSVKLNKAPFARDDRTFFEMVSVKKGVQEPRAIVDCVSCPNRTGNCMDLFNQDDDPDICMDPSCYETKLKHHGVRTRKLAEEAGIKVITGPEAIAIAPKKGELVGHVDLDEECEDDEFPEQEPESTGDDEKDDAAFNVWSAKAEAYRPRTFRQLLAGAKVSPVVIEDPRTHAVRTLVTTKEAKQALKAMHKIDLTHWRYEQQRSAAAAPVEDQAAREARLKKEEAQRERQEEEHAFRRAVLTEIHAKGTGPLKRDDLYLIAEKLLADYEVEQDAQEFFGRQPKIGGMKESELLQLIRWITVSECMSVHAAPKSMLDAARRLKIDPDKIKKDLKAAAQTTDKPAKKTAAKKAKKST